MIITTTEIQAPEMTEKTITLDIFREPGPESDWLNRSCRDAETGVINQKSFLDLISGYRLLLQSVARLTHGDSSGRCKRASYR